MGDATCFGPWLTKGSEKSLEIRSKSLEIGSVLLCGTQDLPSEFDPMPFLLGHVNQTNIPVSARYGEGRPHLLLPGGQPHGFAGFRMEKGWDLRHEN